MRTCCSSWRSGRGLCCSVGEEGADRDSPFSLLEWLGMLSDSGGLAAPAVVAVTAAVLVACAGWLCSRLVGTGGLVR